MNGVRSIILAAAVAGLLGAGCHLIFQYEDTPADSAPAQDVRQDGVTDSAKRLDKKAPPPDKKLQPLDKKLTPMDKKVQPVDKKLTTPDKQPSCPAGQTRCGSVCIDTNANVNNCGACGTKCQDSNGCTQDKCAQGKCKYTPINGGACNSGAGTCSQGKCCTTCIKAGVCVASSTVTACGLGCGSCNSCDDGIDCNNDTCDSTGSCKHSTTGTDGKTCNSGAGKCSGGTCCTGCLTGFPTGTCIPLGSQGHTQCANKGNPCASCPYDNTRVCEVPACISGVCGYENRPGGYTCYTGGKKGTCQNGACCSGCWTQSKVCEPVGSQTVSACGEEGDWCKACAGGELCCNGDCEAPVAGSCP